MRYQYSDGGRVAAGYKGYAGDCVTRAIAIASQMSYQDAYDLVSDNCKRRPRLRGFSSRTGVHHQITRDILSLLGWGWHPTMSIGSGCKVHLRDGELPMGRIIVKLSAHICAVIDGVIHDAHDPRREGTRCVYGYWSKE